MIQVKQLVKTYKTQHFTQNALNGVSLNFRKNEFVAILGPSGSGKTTFLNVVGGLDRYDEGDIIINGKSTKSFKDSDWDAYRNNSVGFVFQSYNLISHLSVLDNVELSMTLAKTDRQTRKQKALDVLQRVGLKDHAYKKPSQLSGGQMQRVAIARAIVNNPDIVFADEPTGALDSITSLQILDLIKEIAHEKLVVMVTHNRDLAYQYANRVVEFKDGEVIKDTNPYTDENIEAQYNPKKTYMSFWTALKLSFKNILTKKWRTSLTAFAASIGIIGVALVLSLSNGFDQQIQEFETSALSNYPITISKTHVNMGPPSQRELDEGGLVEFSDDPVVHAFDVSQLDRIHTNKLDQNYFDYLNQMDQSYLDGYSVERSVNLNVLVKNDDQVEIANGLNLTAFPQKDNQQIDSYLQQYYDLLAGEYPQEETDVIMVVDSRNQISLNLLETLGVDIQDNQVSFSDIIDKELKVVLNNQFYEKQGPIYATRQDLNAMYEESSNINLRIVGILRIKEDEGIVSLNRNLYYSDLLMQDIIEKNKESEIVIEQESSEFNLLTGQPFPTNENGSNFTPPTQMSQNTPVLSKDDVLEMLGANDVPVGISLYPTSFEAKQNVLNYLDEFNISKDKEDQVLYLDLAAVITDLTGNIMDGITLVLVAFATISLIVSMIMIGIIIYISVLERTKEIGILRAIGARKKDITRVFNAETFIIGLFSGLLGIGIAYALTFPINNLIYEMTELPNVAQLNPIHAIGLVLIALILTMIGGFIPSKMAAKKDPVAALRDE